MESRDQVIGVFHENSSIVTVPGDYILYRNNSSTDSDNAVQLYRLLRNALATSFLGAWKGSIWVYDAPKELSHAIPRIARDQGLTVLQTTSDTTSASNDQVFLHPYSSERNLQAKLPQDWDIKTFANLTPAMDQAVS